MGTQLDEEDARRRRRQWLGAEHRGRSPAGNRRGKVAAFGIERKVFLRRGQYLGDLEHRRRVCLRFDCAQKDSFARLVRGRSTDSCRKGLDVGRGKSRSLLSEQRCCVQYLRAWRRPTGGLCHRPRANQAGCLGVAFCGDRKRYLPGLFRCQLRCGRLDVEPRGLRRSVGSR